MKPSTPEKVLPAAACLLCCALVSPTCLAQDGSGSPRGPDLELRPLLGWAYASRSATVGVLGADLGLRVGRFFELQLDGGWYGPFTKSGLAEGPGPVNELRFSTDLDAVVFPLAGTTGRRRGPGGVEPYVLAGLGLLVDKPIAVVDPADRHFGDRSLVTATVGLGARMFVTRWLALGLEVRDLAYLDRLENPSVPSGSTSLPLTDPDNPANPYTFYDARTHFTNDLQVRLGATFVLGARSP